MPKKKRGRLGLYIGTLVLLICAFGSSGVALVSHYYPLLGVSLFLLSFALYNQFRLKV